MMQTHKKPAQLEAGFFVFLVLVAVDDNAARPTWSSSLQMPLLDCGRWRCPLFDSLRL
jgi:hypothetical protein